MKCKQLFEKIEELNETYLDILEDVCNIESPTDSKEGVDAVGNYFIKLANAHGWKAEVFEQSVSGNVVCITLNPEAGAQPISLSGHLDTVHPVGLFGAPAVRRDADYIYGPGVVDCKGGVVAAVLAMDALQQCGYKKRPVQLLLQTDEEKGSLPSLKETINYICKKAESSIAFLNLEGQVDNTACISTKGILRYKFTVHGKAAHSARCADGASAITEAAHKIIELEKMKDATGLTCNCGVIEGGSAANTVAELCTFFADIRFSNKKEMEEAERRVQEVSDNVTIPGCSCIVERVSDRPAMVKTQRNIDLLNMANQIYAENNLPVFSQREGMGGSDAAYITEYGIPCMEGIGIEGKGAHSVNEGAETASLIRAAKRIAAVVYCI